MIVIKLLLLLTCVCTLFETVITLPTPEELPGCKVSLSVVSCNALPDGNWRKQKLIAPPVHNSSNRKLSFSAAKAALGMQMSISQSVCLSVCQSVTTSFKAYKSNN